MYACIECDFLCTASRRESTNDRVSAGCAGNFSWLFRGEVQIQFDDRKHRDSQEYSSHLRGMCGVVGCMGLNWVSL